MMLLLLPLDGFFMLLVRECRLDQGTVIVAYGGARTFPFRSLIRQRTETVHLGPVELTLLICTSKTPDRNLKHTS
jgi:hypothetical protein